MEDAKQSVHANEQVKNELANLASKKQDNNLITEIKPQTERIEWIVILRAVACMAVVMIHVLGSYVKNNCLNNYGTFRTFFDGVLIQPFICFAVPCFMMISGYLLLDPKRDVNISKLIKYSIKILILYIVALFVYVFLFNFSFEYLINFNMFSNWLYQSIIDFIKNLIGILVTEGVVFLWYLPMLIGLYLATPILRIFIKHADKKTSYFVLISLFITTCIIPDFNNLLNINIPTFVEFGGSVFIYLLGYYIGHANLFKDKYIYTAGIIGFFGYLIICLFDMQNQCNAFLVLEAIMVMRLFSSHKIKNNHFINCISKYSLGIYVTHLFWLGVANVIGIYFTMMPPLIGEFVIFAYAIIMSLLSSMILYRLPLVKKLFK